VQLRLAFVRQIRLTFSLSGCFVVQDNLFGKKRLMNVEVVPSKDKKKSKAEKAVEAVLAPVTTPVGLEGMTKASADNKVMHIDSLSFRKYAVGATVLGYVLHMADDHITVSLPGGLTGSVAYSEISDTIHKLHMKHTSESSSRFGNNNKRKMEDMEATMTPLKQLIHLHQPVVCTVLEKPQDVGNGKHPAHNNKGAAASKKQHKTLKLSMRASLMQRGTSFRHLTQGMFVYGCIQSVEDHGYVVTTGIADTVCFMRTKHAYNYAADSTESLAVGTPVACIVEDLNEATKTVNLRAQLKQLMEGITRGSALAFKCINPGMLVHCVVESKLETGLVVNFLNAFHGVIDPQSLPRFASTKDWQACFTVGDVVLARVVYVDHGGKACRLSMRPHVIEFRKPATLLPLGSIVETLQVIDSHRPVGVRLAVDTAATEEAPEAPVSAAGGAGEDTDSAAAAGSKKKSAKANALHLQRLKDEQIVGVFVHKSSLAYRTKQEMLSSTAAHEEGSEDDEAADAIKQIGDGEAPSKKTDEEDEEAAEVNEGQEKQHNGPIDQQLIESRYKVGSVVDKVRLIGYNLVEGLYIGSNMPHSVRSDGDIVHWSQVKVGHIVPVTISAIKETGLIVLINNTVRALCPRMHTADTAMTLNTATDAMVLKMLNKKFRVGQRLRMRVWEANGTSIIVTNKTGFVKDHAVVRSADDEPVDEGHLQTPTIITCFDDAYVGWSGLGIVTQVSDVHGLRIHFYNRMKGLIPLRILTKQGIFSVSEAYRVGQLVSCVVVRKLNVHEEDILGQKVAHRTLILALEIGTPQDVLSLLKGELKSITDSELRQLEGAAEQAADPVDGPESIQDKLDRLDKDMMAPKQAAKVQDGPAFVSGVISAVRSKEEYFLMSLDDGRTGRLPFTHCFEFQQTANKVFESLKQGSTSSEAGQEAKESTENPLAASFSVGQRKENMLIMDTTTATATAGNKGGNTLVFLSLKPLLVNAAVTTVASGSGSSDNSKASDSLTLPTDINSLHAGQYVAGVIIKLDTFGILVRFQNNLIGLVPRSNITDKFLPATEKLSDYFVIGDSIRCIIQKIDATREKIILSCRPSIVGYSMHASSCWMNSSFKEMFVRYLTTSVSSAAFLTYRIGSTIKATVQGIKPYGVILIAPDQNSIMIARGEQHIRACKPGDEVHVCVLDIDYEKNVWEVSMNESLVKTAQSSTSAESEKKGKKSKSKKGGDSKEAGSDNNSGEQLQPGQICSARIELLTQTHMIASVPTSSGQLVAVAVKDYHCPYLELVEYAVGENINVRIANVPSQGSTQSEVKTSPHAHLVMARIDSGENGNKAQQQQGQRLQRQQTPAQQRADFFHRIKLGKVFKWTVHSISPTEISLLPANHQTMNLTENLNNHKNRNKKRSSNLNVLPRFKAVLHVSNAINQSITDDELESVLAEEGRDETSPNLLHSRHPFHGIEVGMELLVKVLQFSSRSSQEEEEHETGKRSRGNSVTSVTSTTSALSEGHNDVDGEGENETDRSALLVHVGISYTSSNTLNDTEMGEDSTAVTWNKLVQWNGKHAIKQGGVYPAVITQFHGPQSSSEPHMNGCTVSLSPFVHGVLSFADVSTKKLIMKAFTKKGFLGQVVMVYVHKMTLEGHNKSLTLNRFLIENAIAENAVGNAAAVNEAVREATKKYIKSLKAGNLVTGIVDLTTHRRVPRPPAVIVSLGLNISARVCVTELADVSDWVDFSEVFGDQQEGRPAVTLLPSGHRHGQVVKCRVLSVAGEGTKNPSALRVEGSLRSSRVDSKDKITAVAEDIIPEDGSLVQGFVANVSHSGCFIRVSHSTTGVCMLKNLSDTFVTNPKELFPMGKLVQARVLPSTAISTPGSMDKDNMLKLSMKSTSIIGDKHLIEKYNQFEVGSFVEGRVKQVTDFGVFVTLTTSSSSGSKKHKKPRTTENDVADIVGLSRKPQACSDENADLSTLFRVGDVVQCKILSVNASSRRIALGLRPSYFKNANHEDDDDAGVEDEGSDGEEEVEDDSEEDDETDEDDDAEEDGLIKMVGDDDSDEEEEDIQQLLKGAAMPSDDEDESEDEMVVDAKMNSRKSSAAPSANNKKSRAVVSEEEQDQVVRR
jgi:ribosomal protein S1